MGLDQMLSAAHVAHDSASFAWRGQSDANCMGHTSCLVCSAADFYWAQKAYSWRQLSGGALPRRVKCSVACAPISFSRSTESFANGRTMAYTRHIPLRSDSSIADEWPLFTVITPHAALPQDTVAQTCWLGLGAAGFGKTKRRYRDAAAENGPLNPVFCWAKPRME